MCPQFLKQVSPLVKPGGIMILSTLNRTLKAYALVIIGAELILRWLPVGTHNWARFVTPEELRRALKGAGLTPTDVTGMVYDPLADEWRLGARQRCQLFRDGRAALRAVRSIRQHGQCRAAISGFQSQEQRAGILDVTLRTALGGRLEGNRRRMVRAANEHQGFRQAPHGRLVDRLLVHRD